MNARALTRGSIPGEAAKVPSSKPIEKIINRTYQLDGQVLNRIWMERLRQKDLLRAQKIHFDLGSPIVSDDRKLRVLTEELGEIARAIDGIENAAGAKKISEAKQHLQEELTQLVACGIAWLESIAEQTK